VVSIRRYKNNFDSVNNIREYTSDVRKYAETREHAAA
jgi:hypothetical protein